MDAFGLFDREHGDDIGMIESGDGFGFTLESLSKLLGVRHVGWEYFQSHLAAELGVLGDEDFAHAAPAELLEDLVVA